MDLRKKEIMRINLIRRNMRKNHIKVFLKLQKRLEMQIYKSLNQRDRQNKHLNQNMKQNLQNTKNLRNMNKKYLIQQKQQFQVQFRIKKQLIQLNMCK